MQILTIPTKGQLEPHERQIETHVSTHRSRQGTSGLERYYFNLTNGEAMIRDDEGVEVSSIQAAMVAALEAAAELRAQDPMDLDEWQGWRLEIVDAAGRAVQSIQLDARSAH